MPKKDPVAALVQAVTDTINDGSSPKQMTRTQYIEALEEIQSDVESRLDAAREEQARSK